MICITCKGRFIPVFKCCPRDSGIARWHFSGSFVHTCQENCDVRWEMAAAAAALALPESSQTSKTLLRSSTRPPHAPMRALLLYLFRKKKQHNHFICCWHGPFQSHDSSQLRCANAFFSPSNNHHKKWKEKKKIWSIWICWLQLLYFFFGLWVSMASFSQIIDTLWWLAQRK